MKYNFSNMRTACAPFSWLPRLGHLMNAISRIKEFTVHWTFTFIISLCAGNVFKTYKYTVNIYYYQSVGQKSGYSTAGSCGSSSIMRLQSDRLARAAGPSDRWDGRIAFKLIQAVIGQIQLLVGCLHGASHLPGCLLEASLIPWHLRFSVRPLAFFRASKQECERAPLDGSCSFL